MHPFVHGISPLKAHPPVQSVKNKCAWDAIRRIGLETGTYEVEEMAKCLRQPKHTHTLKLGQLPKWQINSQSGNPRLPNTKIGDSLWQGNTISIDWPLEFFPSSSRAYLCYKTGVTGREGGERTKISQASKQAKIS